MDQRSEMIRMLHSGGSDYFYSKSNPESLEKFKDLLSRLKKHDIDVNTTTDDPSRETSLARMARCGRVEETKLLMDHPDIDVNKTDEQGRTPLYDAVCAGKYSTVVLLLKDKRVDIDKGDNQGRGLLWIARENGQTKIAEYMLMHTNVDFSKLAYSFLEITEEDPDMKEEDPNMKEELKIMALIEDFKKDKEIAKRDLMMKNNIGQCYDAAHLFLLTILHEEGFLELEYDTQSVHKFFKILSGLPMELRMLICNRVYDYKKDFVSSDLIKLELRLFLLETKK